MDLTISCLQAQGSAYLPETYVFFWIEKRMNHPSEVNVGTTWTPQVASQPGLIFGHSQSKSFSALSRFQTSHVLSIFHPPKDPANWIRLPSRNIDSWSNYTVLNAFPETLVKCLAASNYSLLSLPKHWKFRFSTWNEATGALHAGGMDWKPIHGAHGLSRLCIHDFDQIHVIVLSIGTPDGGATRSHWPNMQETGGLFWSSPLYMIWIQFQFVKIVKTYIYTHKIVYIYNII